MNNMNNKNDLTEGIIWKKLLSFFLPIAAGTVFQQLYNAVDAVIVGKFVSTEALAAVGGSPAILTNVIVGFFTALTSGAAVVIAQHYGAKNHEAVSRCVQTAMLFSAILGFVIGVAMLLASPMLLRLLKTPTETMTDSMIYMRIYSVGCVFILIFNMGCGILRATGDSHRPLMYNVICCFINIGADLFFVIFLQMGVAGVAAATAMTEAISAVLVCRDLLRTKESYRLEPRRLGISPVLLRNMMRIGVPSGLESAMYGISNLILQTGINLLGTVVVASWALSGKIDGIFWALSNAFGAALTNFVGQNFGAGRKDRIRASVKTGFKMAMGGTIAMSVLIMLVSKPLLMFASDDPEVQRVSYQIMMYFVPVYFTWTLIEVLSAVLRGVGDVIAPVIIIAVGVCALRIVWVYTMFRWYPTLFMLCISYPVSWVVADIALLIYYKKGSLLAKQRRSE